jgi:hypothetical protein
MKVKSAHIMIIVTLGISNARYSCIEYQNDRANVLCVLVKIELSFKLENLRMDCKEYFSQVSLPGGGQCMPWLKQLLTWCLLNCH